MAKIVKNLDRKLVCENNNFKIFAHNEAREFAEDVCKCLGVPLGKMDVFQFANSNTFVKLQESVRGKDVFIIQANTPPVNERVMELLISIDAIMRASAKSINVVLPYYPYSRSDKKDQPRVPITASLIARLLEASGVDRVLTCDLHNNSIQGFFQKIPCTRLTAEYMLVKYIKEKNFEDMVVVSTDVGSSKKAHKYKKHFNCGIALCDKTREGNDDNATIDTIVGNVEGKVAVIFDDEVDTAGTMADAIKIVKKNGAKKVYAACTHGVLSKDGAEKIKNSGVDEFITTDTVPVPEEKRFENMTILSSTFLFAEAIKKIVDGESMEVLFQEEKEEVNEENRETLISKVIE